MTTQRLNIGLAVANALLLILALYYIGSRGLASPPTGWEYKDLIAIVLTALAVILAALTIGIGALAIWGYTTIREAAIDAAETKADASARDIAESVATRVAREALGTMGTDRTDDLTAALSRGNDERPTTESNRNSELPPAGAAASERGRTGDEIGVDRPSIIEPRRWDRGDDNPRQKTPFPEWFYNPRKRS